MAPHMIASGDPGLFVLIITLFLNSPLGGSLSVGFWVPTT